MSDHGVCGGQSGCTESSADDSIRTFSVPDGWALAEEVAATKPSNHRWHIWSLDVDDVRVVIQSGDFAGTLPEDLADMHAIIESIQIEP